MAQAKPDVEVAVSKLKENVDKLKGVQEASEKIAKTLGYLEKALKLFV